MKTLVLSAAILALAATVWAEVAKTDSAKGPEAPVLRRLPPLDASKLDPNYREDWKYEEFSDEKRGIFVHVVEQKQEKPPIGWSSGSDVISESGTNWIRVVKSSPQRVLTVRIRLTADTMSYLITTPEAPLLPRYIALREISRLEGLPQSERLRMIELASRDVRAEMRYMAVLGAGEYMSECDTIPILCRALCDPSGRVAKAACGLLISYVCPHPDASVSPLGLSGCYSIGASTLQDLNEKLERHLHSAALRDARRIHEVRPDMVTDDDLATMEALSKGLAKKPEAKLDVQPPAKSEEKPDAKIP